MKIHRGFTLENIAFHYTVDPATGCWNWKKAIVHTGYGMKKCGSKNKLAHRLSFELHKGKIPKGKIVMHTCDNRACINPEHLRAGTNGENVRDCIAKGRFRTADKRGEKNPMKVLTTAIVNEARQRSQDGETITAIAAKLGVNRLTISDAIRRITWTHLP